MNLRRCTGCAIMLSKTAMHRVAKTLGTSHSLAYFRGNLA